MKAQDFLTKEEQQQISDCVAEVELSTSGEIVPYIATRSHDYPSSTIIGSLLLSLTAAIFFAALFDFGELWKFLVIFVPSFIALNLILPRWPWLRRKFTGRERMMEEVERAAVSTFFLQGLHRTRDMTGILIYISVYERKVHILADKGINDKVDPSVWTAACATVTTSIADGRAAEGICKAIKMCGELVSDKFPIKPDDENELPNLIIE